MSDNTQLNPGTGGDIISTDDISGVKVQRVKVQFGTDGVAADVSASNLLPVDGSGVTQPISASALPLPSGAATGAKQDTGNTSLASIDGKITAVNTGAVVVSSSALPSGAATSAKQPALGTAGTASADVLTVQGRASMTPLLVDASATTQPVSLASTTITGTVAVTESGTWNVGLTAGSNAVGTVGTTSAAVNVGQQTVNTTAVQISASSTVPTNGIIIKALSTNAASLFVGGSGVTTSTGYELVPGEAVSFSCNLNTLYIISVASTTDKIAWNVE